MRRIATRLAVFALVLTGAFGGAYALGKNAPPVHPPSHEDPDHGVVDHNDPDHQMRISGVLCHGIVGTYFCAVTQTEETDRRVETSP